MSMRTKVIAKFTEAISACPDPAILVELNQALLDYVDGAEKQAVDGVDAIVKKVKRKPLTDGGIDTNYREFQDPTYRIQPRFSKKR